MRKLLTIITVVLMTSPLLLSQNNEFNTSDLKKIAEKVEFKFVNKFKHLSGIKLLEFYNTIEADRSLIKQINIDSWAVCEHYNIDNFEIYNYYYKSISRATFNQYCKELNALMIIDGTTKQLK